MLFQPSDLITIGMLVLLEGLLSADNALVLALLVRHLRKSEQEKALNWGFLMSFALRLVGIALAGLLMKLWWLCGLGAAYLLYLTTRHIISKQSHKDEDDANAQIGPRFWQTVWLVGLTDVAFAVDSILAAVALAGTQKIWLVYVGGTLGIILLRVAAGAFIRLLKRYPRLDDTAYALVGWAGVKLGFEALHLWGGQNHTHVVELPTVVFWSVFAAIIGFGTFYAVRYPAAPDEPEDATDEALKRAADTFEGKD